MTYRPDEEIPEGLFRMPDHRTDLANDNRLAPFRRIAPRDIVLYGFLASLFGAAAAALGGLVVVPALPVLITTSAGAALGSAAGWFALGRRG